jgi:Flp pilus assembly protein protease CpaA
MKIPDKLNILIGAAGIYREATGFTAEQIPIIALSFLILALLLDILLYFFPGGIGGGDIKLLFCLVPFFEVNIFTIIWFSSVGGLLHHLILNGINSRSPVPWGAYISLTGILFLILN